MLHGYMFWSDRGGGGGGGVKSSGDNQGIQLKQI